MPPAPPADDDEEEAASVEEAAMNPDVDATVVELVGSSSSTPKMELQPSATKQKKKPRIRAKVTYEL